MRLQIAQLSSYGNASRVGRRSGLISDLRDARRRDAGAGFVGTVQWHGPFGDLDIKTKSDTFDLKLKTKGDSDLYVTRNAIAAGGTSGWHTHPGPSLVTVTLGEITVYDAAVCAPTRYGLGETFVDDGDHVHLIRNESGAAAETAAVQLIPRGATRRIDAEQPNNCPTTLH
jgi:quercetin dioxygenase-like cupin family protein